MNKKIFKTEKGFTLVELLIAIFIIALIGSLVAVYFFQIRKNVRDSKRLSDISEIQLALENYKFFEGEYPSELISGEPLIGSTTGKIFLNKIPKNPDYYTFDCNSSDYSYSYDSGSELYKISFCLEGPLEDFSAGGKCVLPGNILNYECPYGLYSIQEISDMIYNQGYIPVASDLEFNSLRNVTSQTMGLGTQWEGSYLTGYTKKYIQVKEIDLSSFNSGDGWVPFGLFSGIYDGNELPVSNLFINNESLVRAALFSGVSNGGSLKNVRIEDAFINGGTYVGSLVAYFQLGEVINCGVTGIQIIGKQDIGGLVGYHTNSGVISSSFAKEGTINATSSRYVGGLVGVTTTNYINNIYNSYASVDINLISTSNAGGFIGGNLPNNTIENSFSTGSVFSSSGNIGGFAGVNTGSIVNSYYDLEESGRSDVGKGVPRTTKQMKEGYSDSVIDGDNIYVGWSDEIWKFVPSNSYPILR